MKGYKSEKFLYYVNTNSYPKFDVNILQDDRKKDRKLNLYKIKYLVCNQVKRNKSQTGSVLCQDKLIYQIVESILQDRRRKSAKRKFCKGQ